MDIFTGKRLQEEAKETLEKEIERKLTIEELELFYKTSKMCLLKGYRYAKEYE